MKLSGRRILVTGAASGMGEAIAALFAQEGASLALIDRDGARVAAVAARLGAGAHACDVSILTEVERTVALAAEAMGGVDGVVNAAGVLVQKPFAELDPESWNRMLAVNLSGPYHVIRAALPALRQAERATIVNVASVSGYMPMDGTSGYSASKGGLIMLTKSLGLELGPGIRANAICPGVVRTEMTRHIWENPDHSRRAEERTALKTLGLPADVANAALFLSTEESRFMTGTELVVDGGFSWR